MTRHVPLAAGFVLVTALIGMSCSGQAKSAPEAAPPLEVRTARVSMADVADTFEAGGVVHAATTATLAARILAPVREVRVASGDRVRAGQVLIVLDGAAMAAQARSARSAAVAAEQSVIAASADLRGAEAALTLARATHERISGLHAKRSATAQELDNATEGLRVAEARAAAAAARAQAASSGVESARAASDASSATAAFAAITAPFAGVVSEKLVEPGNMASPGTPLLRLEDTRGFRLDVRIDESRVGHISVGSPVPVVLDSADGADATVAGTVSEIARAVDADTRAFLVKIALPGSAATRSGTFGRARFTGRTRRSLQLPDSALVRRGQLTSVFVVDNGIARLRLVNVSGTEILAGLTEGETVILTPAAVTDGRRVITAGGR